jgi:Arc/MetJ-type ribon-helix-helix transcriptional regulator
MKLSVSLPDADIDIVDAYVRTKGLASRSAALHQAVLMLRFPDLEREYELAWGEFLTTGEHAIWDQTVADGDADAPR